MLSATVVPVTVTYDVEGRHQQETIRDWCCHPSDTYYVMVPPSARIRTPTW